MRGSKGKNLPDGAAALGTQLPIDLQRHEAKTLKVVVKGSNMPADEYNGILLISVNKQPNALRSSLAPASKGWTPAGPDPADLWPACRYRDSLVE